LVASHDVALARIYLSWLGQLRRRWVSLMYNPCTDPRGIRVCLERNGDWRELYVTPISIEFMTKTFLVSSKWDFVTLCAVVPRPPDAESMEIFNIESQHHLC
jgi:hypothetical protein